ncbi:aminotransferase class V-fold PLP-dependent enzyme [Spiribacter halobius]|nr:aminotransferase class V-fold PLP-dependent enzyme [Spiribacter halobius]UEX76681.1 aminotransferase class V-fold PLP-dependent enzyme [Spiribacter halobius]
MPHPEIPLDPDLIYLNHAGVGPWTRAAGEAVRRFAEVNVARGAAEYPEWLAVERRLRERLARLIGAGSADDIALVKNTSEGLSLVAQGLDWRPGDNVVINDQEFPSNRMPWEALAASHGVEVREVRLDAAQSPEDALIAAMDARTRVLPVSAVQYATGLRLDLERLGQACADRGALFCVDAIQHLGALPFDAAAVGADFVVADGHKWMLGPEGLGVLYVHPDRREQLRLLQHGWHMAEAAGDYDRRDWTPASTARRFEPGSPNLLAAHALEASLGVLEGQGMAAVGAAVQENVEHLLARLDAEPALSAITPSARERRAGIVTFRVAGADGPALWRALRAEGVIAASRKGGIRFSPHFHNSPQDIDRAVDRVLALKDRPAAARG